VHDMKLRAPVVFIVFNRPETTRVVFERIRDASPSKLLVIADGPRDEVDGEKDKCEQVRAVIDGVDWPCEVMTNYSDVNMGCRMRVVSGLNWVFSEVEEAIIIEDDCLPDYTFFRFCDDLLERYRNDERIMSIGGNCSRYGGGGEKYSYYFSRYPHIWGWATWRRAWAHYDMNMALWPEIRDSGLLNGMFCNKRIRDYRIGVFDKAYSGELDAWSPAWVFACWLHGALGILPNKNLVSNIGFGEDATHTTGKNRTTANGTVPLTFPLSHPPYMLRDSMADMLTEKKMFCLPLYKILNQKIKKIVMGGRHG